MRQRWPVVCLALLLAGCGGSGGGGTTPNPEPKTARPTLEIAWSERSRAFSGPSSALSATITYADVLPNGQDLTFTVDRPAAPAATTQAYASRDAVEVGPTTVRIAFYAAAGGQGDLVGTAETSAVIREDGGLEKPSGGPLGSVVTDGRVDSVVIAADQRMKVRETKPLIYTAHDASDNVLAVSPGSFTVQTNSDALQLNADGTATGKKVGTAEITVAIDGKQATGTVTVEEGDLVVRTIELKANDLVYSPVTQRVYLAGARTDPTYASRVVAIDPANASVTRSEIANGDANVMTIAPDGRTIWFSLKQEGILRRFDAETWQASTAIGIGRASNGETMYAEDIAVHPTDPGTIAVSVAPSGTGRVHAAVFMFKNGVRQPTYAKGTFSNNRIEWGGQADTVYGLNTETTEHGIRKFKVIPDGIEQTASVSNYNSWDGDMIYGGGRIYVENGTVWDAATLQTVGQFPMEAGTRPMAIDFTARRAYALTHDRHTEKKTLWTFDLDSFAQISSKTIPDPIPGWPTKMIVAGPGRLAFTTDAGRVGFIDLEG